MNSLYDTIGLNYADLRRPDPRIAQQVDVALGDAQTVLNVGAGAGSYEPLHRRITAVEPSSEMIRQRTAPAARIVQRLRRAGLPATLSQDAGAYLCNAILFHSLRLGGGLASPAASGFIHIPTRLPRRSAELTFDDAVRGGLEIVATALRRSPAPRRLMASAEAVAPGPQSRP